MITFDKISTLDDMTALMRELHRLEVKCAFDFYGVLSDLPSRKFLPQWLQKKGAKSVSVSEKGNDAFLKINNSSKDAVVVYDLETSDVNGLQFLASLEKNQEMRDKCKVILAVPANIPPDAKNQLLSRGASALVAKPISEESMQAAFEKIGLGY